MRRPVLFILSILIVAILFILSSLVTPSARGTFVSPTLDHYLYLPQVTCANCPTAQPNRPTPTSIFPTATPTVRPTLSPQ